MWRVIKRKIKLSEVGSAKHKDATGCHVMIFNTSLSYESDSFVGGAMASWLVRFGASARGVPVRCISGYRDLNSVA